MVSTSSPTAVQDNFPTATSSSTFVAQQDNPANSAKLVVEIITRLLVRLKQRVTMEYGRLAPLQPATLTPTAAPPLASGLMPTYVAYLPMTLTEQLFYLLLTHFTIYFA